MADIQEKISAARKEAEALKEKIKQKKEALADTTCNNIYKGIIPN
jgi:guanine nucleotide-binding protein G(I)/G(S)/G(T) subunit beta-1